MLRNVNQHIVGHEITQSKPKKETNDVYMKMDYSESYDENSSIRREIYGYDENYLNTKLKLDSTQFIIEHSGRVTTITGKEIIKSHIGYQDYYLDVIFIFESSIFFLLGLSLMGEYTKGDGTFMDHHQPFFLITKSENRKVVWMMDESHRNFSFNEKYLIHYIEQCKYEIYNLTSIINNDSNSYQKTNIKFKDNRFRDAHGKMIGKLENEEFYTTEVLEKYGCDYSDLTLRTPGNFKLFENFLYIDNHLVINLQQPVSKGNQICYSKYGYLCEFTNKLKREKDSWMSLFPNDILGILYKLLRHS